MNLERRYRIFGILRSAAMILAVSQGILSALAILTYAFLVFFLTGEEPNTKLVVCSTIGSIVLFHVFVQFELYFADKMVTLLYIQRQKEARKK